MASTSQELSYSGVLDRALAIIELLTESADGLPLSAISENLRIPRSATHRLLTSLSGHGYVRQEEERGTYVLTSKIQVLAFRHLSVSGFVDAVQPVINRLAMETGELVRLAVADNGRLTWVARAQGARSGLRYDPDMGMEARLSCSATGYAWLSCMSDEAALALVEAQGLGTPDEFGPAAPQTGAEVLERVELARQRGYAVAIQTFTDWMSAMAAPLVHPVSDKAIGVVSVAGPVFRLTEARLHEYAPLLLEAVEEISHLIPGSPALMNPAMAALSARQGLIS
ncbi:IclR family transcriptional regulator [Paraburkholderia sp. GAS334]|uniref:IclR family transcriptional regulator n=1 Tax=Paraburkholderia sp. GAS334 TaxID=3035131 RepID=UPI003D216CBF